MIRHSRFAMIFALGAALAASACVRAGEMKETTASIPLAGISSADIRLKMGAGEIKVRGGSAADVLLSGIFRTNVARWEAVVVHRPAGNGERVTIEQRHSTGIGLGSSRNTWDLTLTDAIPLELDMSFGAGEAAVDLRGVQSKRLTVHMGAGEVKLDLSGDRTIGLEGTLKGGVGSGTITLPSQVGVRVRVEGGIGSVRAPGFAKNDHEYTNDAYGKTAVAVELSIHAGIGSIDLRLAGPKTSAF
jgi:hypothetical protein